MWALDGRGWRDGNGCFEVAFSGFGNDLLTSVSGISIDGNVGRESLLSVALISWVVGMVGARCKSWNGVFGDGLMLVLYWS